MHPHFLQSLYLAANFPPLKLSLISCSSFPVFLSRTQCSTEPIFLAALFSCHFITLLSLSLHKSFPSKNNQESLFHPTLPLLCRGNRRNWGVCVGGVLAEERMECVFTSLSPHFVLEGSIWSILAGGLCPDSGINGYASVYAKCRDKMALCFHLEW